MLQTLMCKQWLAMDQNKTRRRSKSKARETSLIRLMREEGSFVYVPFRRGQSLTTLIIYGHHLMCSTLTPLNDPFTIKLGSLTLLSVCLEPQSDGGTQSSLAWGRQNKRTILIGEQAGFKAGRPRGIAPEPKVSHITKQVGLAPKGQDPMWELILRRQLHWFTQHTSTESTVLSGPLPLCVCATFVKVCVANLSDSLCSFKSWMFKGHLKLGRG